LAYVAAFVFLFYAIAILVYRVFLRFFHLLEGPITPGSKLHFTYHVYLLFHIIPFYPLVRSISPPMLMGLIYTALGAKLGLRTSACGVILDPPFTVIGDDTLLGHDCVVYAHAIEDGAVSHHKVRIGSNVTVGAKAVIMPGVVIEDHAVVGTGAVVTKGTHIRTKEVWAGVPARKIKTLP
jgi:serine acetyltransferase